MRQQNTVQGDWPFRQPARGVEHLLIIDHPTIPISVVHLLSQPLLHSINSIALLTVACDWNKDITDRNKCV